MIDMTDILSDPDLSEPFTIQRNPGQNAIGGWQTGQVQVIAAYGAIRNVSGKEIELVPEGDRVKEMISFRSTTPMYMTSASQGITSDLLTWKGTQYRVLWSKNYTSQAYTIAIAGRIKGD